MGTLRGAVAWRIPPALPMRRVPRPLLSRNSYGTATLWWVVLSSSSCPGPLATCRRSSSTPSLRSSEVRPRVGAPSSRVFDLVCFFYSLSSRPQFSRFSEEECAGIWWPCRRRPSVLRGGCLLDDDVARAGKPAIECCGGAHASVRNRYTWLDLLTCPRVTHPLSGRLSPSPLLWSRPGM